MGVVARGELRSRAVRVRLRRGCALARTYKTHASTKNCISNLAGTPTLRLACHCFLITALSPTHAFGAYYAARDYHTSGVTTARCAFTAAPHPQFTPAPRRARRHSPLCSSR